MAKVQVLCSSRAKNFDGKIYTEALVDKIIEELKICKLVFTTATPGPKSQKEIIGKVSNVYKEKDLIYADMEYYPAFEELNKIKVGIVFTAFPTESYNVMSEMCDVDDIRKPIFFAAVPLQ